jgi:hypothetical protein
VLFHHLFYTWLGSYAGRTQEKLIYTKLFVRCERKMFDHSEHLCDIFSADGDTTSLL